MTAITDTNGLATALRTLKLSGMLGTLEARLAQARAGDLGHLEFLQVLCEDEISRRSGAAIGRRLHRARFEEQATFEGFDFTASPGIPAAQIRDLAALRWLAAENQSSCPARPASARPSSPAPSGTRPSAPGTRPASPRPAASSPTWPAAAPTTPGTSA
jgi:IstB-like ATP binding protein